MSKIHNISKSASINREGNLNEYLQYSTNAHKLYWNLIGQNKSIQPKFWPTSSTTSDWSKVGHKDIILTTLLKASGRLQTERQKTANQDHTDRKPTSLCRMNLYMLCLLTIKIYSWITSHFNPSSGYCQQFHRKDHSCSQDGTNDRLMPTKHWQKLYPVTIHYY